MLICLTKLLSSIYKIKTLKMLIVADRVPDFQPGGPSFQEGAGILIPTFGLGVCTVMCCQDQDLATCRPPIQGSPSLRFI